MKFVRNAIALVGTQAVTSALGFVYWWLAARWFPPASVGLASAMVSTMTLLGTLGMLGLGTLLIGELPRQRWRAPQLVTTSVLVAGAVSGLLGLFFALASPFISHELAALAREPLQLGLFALGTSMTSMGLVLDQAAIGVMRGGLQFWRNVVFSVFKLAALLLIGAWLGDRAGFSIFLTWVFAVGFSLLFVVLLEITQGKLNETYRPALPALQGFGRDALQHHALNLVLMGPGLVLPLIVTVLLSARTNAFFYTAWMLNSFVMVVPVVLATVLYAAGAENPAALHQRLKLTLLGATAYGLLAVAVVAFAGRWVLHFFGPDYAREAGPALTILSTSVFPLVISEHYVTLKRIERRPARALAPLGASGILQIAFGALGARLGDLTGLSIGLVAGATLVALFLILPVFGAVGLLGRGRLGWRGQQPEG